jgi:hypothetical protein
MISTQDRSLSAFNPRLSIGPQLTSNGDAAARFGDAPEAGEPSSIPQRNGIAMSGPIMSYIQFELFDGLFRRSTIGQLTRDLANHSADNERRGDAIERARGFARPHFQHGLSVAPGFASDATLRLFHCARSRRTQDDLPGIRFVPMTFSSQYAFFEGRVSDE